MTHRHVWRGCALMAVALTYSLLTVAPAFAQTRDAALLPPEQSGWVTVVGCLQPRGTHGGKYALASPMGPVASVPDDTCSASVDERAFELDDPQESGITEALLGHWIEIYGKLEKETSTDPTNLRELDVKSFRMVPVVRPIAEAAPASPPQLEPQPDTTAAPEEIPVATTGFAEPTLPATASPLPFVGLLGLLSLAGALALHRYRSPRTR